MALSNESKQAIKQRLDELERRKRVVQKQKRGHDYESSRLRDVIVSINDDISKLTTDLNL